MLSDMHARITHFDWPVCDVVVKQAEHAHCTVCYNTVCCIRNQAHAIHMKQHFGSLLVRGVSEFT